MGVQRNSGKRTGKQSFRFYKSHLPAVVWDPAKGRALATFAGGAFTTEDLRVAEILLDKGYPQVAVDAIAPPDVIVAIPGQSLKEGENAPLKGENERVQGKPTLIPIPHADAE